MRIFSLCVVELFKVFILGLSMRCFYATTLKINVWNDNFSVHFLLMSNIHILWKELVWKNSDLQRTEAIKLSAFCQQCFFNILTKNLLPCFLFIINYLRNSKIIVIDQLIRFLWSNNLTSSWRSQNSLWLKPYVQQRYFQCRLIDLFSQFYWGIYEYISLE